MKTSLCVDSILNRLKKLVGVYSDAQLARSLGVTPSNISSWRRRNSPPYKKCVEIAAEHDVSMDWILFGDGDATNDGASYESTSETSPRLESGFSDPRDLADKSGDRLAEKIVTGREDIPRYRTGASSYPDGFNPSVVDGAYTMSGAAFRQAIRRLLLTLNDAGTIDLRDVDATVIVDALMKDVYRTMRETKVFDVPTRPVPGKPDSTDPTAPESDSPETDSPGTDSSGTDSPDSYGD